MWYNLKKAKGADKYTRALRFFTAMLGRTSNHPSIFNGRRSEKYTFEDGREITGIQCIIGTSSRMMITDEYGEGTFFTQMTKDFKNFKQVQRSKYSVNHLNPRHGSVPAISMEDYNRLVEVYTVAE